MIGKHSVTLEVAYPNHEDSDMHLRDSLDKLIKSYNRRLNPSRLLFICPDGVQDRIKLLFDRRSESYTPALRSVAQVALAPYDKRGKLLKGKVKILLSRGNGSTAWITDQRVEEIGREVISIIFKNTKTILKAPHGYVFEKPSGRKEKIFMRAGNMLREPNSLVVFNHMLLRKLPDKCNLLYIDSFTVLSFALGLKSLFKYFACNGSQSPQQSLSVESTHSYDIDSEFRIPNEANYFILISASTSGGLAKKLIAEKQAAPERIAHLIGVGSSMEDELRSSSIYFHVQDSADHANNQQSSAIRISTEEFLVNHGQPTPVAITQSHVNKKGAHELHKIFYQKNLRFDAPVVPKQRHSYFSVSPKISDKDFSSSPISLWIDQNLLHELPISSTTLVYADDNASKQIANHVRSRLELLWKKKIPLMPLNQIKNFSGKNNSSVVIIAYQDPGFEHLLEASIELRSSSEIVPFRHYVVGYSFPATLCEYRKLKKDLQMNSSDQKWGWSEYFVLPAGHDLVHQSLSLSNREWSEKSITEHEDSLGQNLHKSLLKRCHRESISATDLFLPSASGHPLKLGLGSVFFEKDYKTDVSQIAVYAMVSAAMQKAREPLPVASNSSTPRTLGFDYNPFVKSVLDPRMFARYSDGILQASFLRAALSSELDYAADNELSRQFTSICKAVFTNYSNLTGAASLEFVHALVTEKFSLKFEDRATLFSMINEIPILRAFRDLVASNEYFDMM